MTDLIGQKFGEWLVVARCSDRPGERGAGARYWLCRCSCEAQSEREVCERNLSRGTSTSCGCSRGGRPSTRFINLVGQQFERWTVLYKTKTDEHDNTYWMCACACGTEREVSGKSLTSGKSHSCGCLKAERASERLKGKPSGKLEDLIGQTFGKWTVLSLAYRRYPKNKEGGPQVFWNCKCECGTERIVNGATMKGGHSKSCGCSPFFNDLTDTIHGRLTAIRPYGRSNDGHVIWLCRCVCGNEAYVDGHVLSGGRIGSCGCAREDGAIVRPDHVRQKKAEDTQRQYREDIKFNLNRRMSAMIRLALRREGSEKGGRHWPELVGYTVEELRTHLETTMPDGYSWNDYLEGKLHIDHVIPLSAHNYELPTHIDFQRAWALTNLRLLPGLDNMVKNNRLDQPFQPSFAY